MDFLSADSLPWLSGAQQRLRASFAAERLPHSLLVLAAPGLGAELLANWITAFVLCESPQPQPQPQPQLHPQPRPCGTCAPCRLLQADTHPDVHAVRLEEDARQIKVDQVRGLIEALTLKSYRGGYKVGVIEGAEMLNANGANAFLKTLEEPTANTLLIMIARPNHRLPATIASRCLRLYLAPPSTSVALAWLDAQSVAPSAAPSVAPSAAPSAAAQSWEAALNLAGGAPLRAVEMHAAGLGELDADMHESLRQLRADKVDVTLLAERWIKTDPALRMMWLENWITRRVLASLGGTPLAQSAEPVSLPGALLKAKIRSLFKLLDAARELRLLAPTGINQQLALEALLIGGRTALEN